MGGLAFSSDSKGGLETPRMPPEVYNLVRQQCVETLHALYSVVTVPVEGPEKKSHGDIDIMVAEPKALYQEQKSVSDNTLAGYTAKTDTSPLDAIIHLLNPERALKTHAKDGDSANLAMPWPSHLLPSATDDTTDDTTSKIFESIQRSKKENHHGKLYIQVDVRICSSAEDLHWRAFKHAHGDIWNLLGTMIRPYGLTADERGLTIRIEEMEKLSQKRSRVVLSNKPCDVLEFLGMDNYPPTSTARPELENKGKVITGRLANASIWPKQFPTIHEMYEYAATCRMFWLKPETPPNSPGQSDENDEPPRGGISHYTIESEGAPKKENLKSQDRRRMNMRPVFRKWIEQFLPSLREELSAKLAGSRAAKISAPVGNETEKRANSSQTDQLVTNRHTDTSVESPSDEIKFPYPTSPVYTREEIRALAFASFPGVQEKYESELASWTNEQNTNAIKRGLKEWIPKREWQTVQWRGECQGAFRRMLFEGSEDFVFTERDADPEYPLRNSRGVWSAENVRRFVETHWEKVGERAGAWYGGLYREKLEAKTQKKAKDAAK
ncbi:hypothetical protein MKZ38_001701 [Zalerion maritima]|uniref:Uncharacterized protein n=1 Tax=Zalerion maritima TaxID=339359 RepID=A0AAD5RRJ3_9PEZI|nr:hypothetical protein MKZ38_001701 [Zalerion maritima]